MPRSLQKPEYAPLDPITHPLYGVAPAQNIPPSNGYMEPQIQNPPFAPNTMYNPNFEQPVQLPLQATAFMPPPPPNPDAYNQSAVTNIQNMNMPAQPQVVPEPREPVQKAPLSDEHKIMQTVLDDLRSRCSTSANNPQTKRKLEDVGKKLESLYDLLREDKLSLNTLSALHQLVQFSKGMSLLKFNKVMVLIMVNRITKGTRRRPIVESRRWLN